MVEVVGSIEGAFKFLKDNPLLMVPFLVVFIVSTVLSTVLLSDFAEQVQQLSQLAATNPNAVFSAFIQLFYSNAVNITVVILISSLLSLFGGLWAINAVINPKKSLTDNAKAGLDSFLPALGSVILFGLLVIVLASVAVLTLFTLIIPLVIVVALIYISVRLLFYSQAIVIDKKGVVSSLQHSWELTKGNWWNTFGFFILFAIIMGIIGFVFSLLEMLHIIIPQLLNSVVLGSIGVAGFTLYYKTLKPAKLVATPKAKKTS